MNERISFDSSPSRSGIPSRNAFAAESVQPSRFHSVREASAHLDAQRAKRREEESRTIRHQRLSESPVTHAVDADFDELVGELDRLDQMSQKESMRHGVKTPSDAPIQPRRSRAKSSGGELILLKRWMKLLGDIRRCLNRRSCARPDRRKKQTCV